MKTLKELELMACNRDRRNTFPDLMVNSKIWKDNSVAFAEMSFNFDYLNQQVCFIILQ
jgi:hypothetical protein